MTTTTLITYQNHYLDAAARLYEHAYAVRPYEDKSAFEISREIVQGQVDHEGFVGVLVIDDHQEVVGLAWGYDTPSHNKRMTEIITKRMGAEWVQDTLLVESFAMHLDHHSPELAAHLNDGLAKRAAEDGYARMRVRLDIPRLDNLDKVLHENAWQKLQALAHVVWLGRTL